MTLASHPSLRFLEGGGAMGERIRAFDWANHPLGPPERWPESLQMALSLCLNSSFPTAIYWGPDFYILYNDAWSEIPAEKHPWILGQQARVGWSDIWPIIGPQFQQVFDEGEGLALYEQMLPMVRGGQPRETWWNYSFTPIRDAEHQVVGVYNQGNEITAMVHGRRKRLAELQRWRELFRQAPAGIALLRGPKHVFEFANEAYERLVGNREVTGKTVTEALPEVLAQGFVELLDGVYRSGEPYIGAGAQVKLQRRPDGPVEDCVVDFIYRPMRDADGEVDGIFVLVTDVTERARAESALRITNWQLGEERARLSALIEAEQRAREALRRFNENLEAHVRTRTTELTQALDAQRAGAERLRAAFATDLLWLANLDADGKVLEANQATLQAAGCTLEDLVGRPYWEAPFFAASAGTSEQVRGQVHSARRATVRAQLTLQVGGSARAVLLSVRPVHSARGELTGLVAEALDLTGLTA